MAAVITVVVLYEILVWLADYAAEKGQGKFIRRLIVKVAYAIGTNYPRCSSPGDITASRVTREIDLPSAVTC